MSEDWSDWFWHDGSGCQCVGQYVHLVYKDGFEWKGRATGGGSWRNGSGPVPIIRYRIRKPRGMTILEGLLENLPEKVDA